MQPYDPAMAATMKRLYDSLNEKDRRRYAGIEALKLGFGGRRYIAGVLGCSRRTVSKGAREVSGPVYPKSGKRAFGNRVGDARTIKPSGPGSMNRFWTCCLTTRRGIRWTKRSRWTNLSLEEIVTALWADHDIQVSKTVVRQLLKKHGYRRRKAQKKRTMKRVGHRTEQFEHIARLKAEYEAAGHPIVSMDTKKKEDLGNFYRDGQLYTREELQVYDHDFKSFAEGVVIPHGLYDVQRNIGYLHLGTSHDTSEFACDSFRYWWYTYGQRDYPQATSILVLCDGGGSNSARHYLFKQDLQALADEIGVEIRIAHYPPYCSKYNPIEHRLFPHVTRACQGVVFTGMKVVQELMAKTQTQTGLKVFVHVMDKVYRTGRKVAADFKENIRISL